MSAALDVARVDGVFTIERFATEIDRLNAASRRPNAFSSAAFLESYALRNEYHVPGSGERLFLVRERGRVIGCAPMRLSAERVTPSLGPLAVCASRLDFLASADTEQLQFLCAPEDEARVSAAVIGHLCEREPGWGLLELVGQPPGGALHRAVHAMTGRRFWARDIEVQPFTEVPLIWSDLKDYFRSLTKHMRSNVGRQARRLYATGQTELVLARGGVEVNAWFDAYCDLDARSWKGGTESSIARSPRRVRLYREIAQGRAGFDPSFVGVILDGVLVAGLLVGSNETASRERHGAWCLEMAYDRSRADLGPGQLLLLLAVGEALARRDGFLNFLQNFAYYKHRWGAAALNVVNLQLLRRFSLHDGRARVGDLRHWWLARKEAKAAKGAASVVAALSPEPTKEHPEPSAAVPGAALGVDWAHARRLTAAAFAASGSGSGLRVLDRAAARSYLPFDLE